MLQRKRAQQEKKIDQMVAKLDELFEKIDREDDGEWLFYAYIYRHFAHRNHHFAYINHRFTYIKSSFCIHTENRHFSMVVVACFLQRTVTMTFRVLQRTVTMTFQVIFNDKNCWFPYLKTIIISC